MTPVGFSFLATSDIIVPAMSQIVNMPTLMWVAQKGKK
jgi:hypothetical protein